MMMKPFVMTFAIFMTVIDAQTTPTPTPFPIEAPIPLTSPLVNVSSIPIFQNCTLPYQVSLTFDDGPTNMTGQILDILKHHNVSATFFINGLHTVDEGLWAVTERIYNENHILGTHTFSHPALSKINDFNIERELMDNELIIRMITNKRPSFFRPPYFDYNDHIISIVKTFGYSLALANLDTEDWLTQNSTEIYDVINSKINQQFGGSFVVLQHAQIPETVAVLSQIITWIQSQGFEIVPLDVCTGINRYQPDNLYGPFMLNGVAWNGSLK